MTIRAERRFSATPPLAEVFPDTCTATVTAAQPQSRRLLVLTLQMGALLQQRKKTQFEDTLQKRIAEVMLNNTGHDSGHMSCLKIQK